MNDDVNYTFYDKPKFLSPNIEQISDDIDESSIETIEPNDKLLMSVANKLSPKKKQIYSIFESLKQKRPKGPKRKTSKRKTSKRKRSRSKI